MSAFRMFTVRLCFSLRTSFLFIFIKFFIPDKVIKFHIKQSCYLHQRLSNGGCDELVHHLETVVGAHPNCFDSQRLDFFFSASITFRRFRSLLLAITICLLFAHKVTQIISDQGLIVLKGY